MDKIKTLKVKQEDGSLSDNTYYIGIDAVNVDMKNGENVQDVIGDIDFKADGNISEQLNKLKERIAALEEAIKNGD